MTDVATAVEIVAFSVVKSGSADPEWEDGAGYDPGDPRSGRRPGSWWSTAPPRRTTRSAGWRCW